MIKALRAAFFFLSGAKFVSLWMFQLRQYPVNTNRPMLRMYFFFFYFCSSADSDPSSRNGNRCSCLGGERGNASFFSHKFLDVVRDINPFHPNISMHILNTVLHTSTKVQTRRICLTIKSFLSW